MKPHWTAVAIDHWVTALPSGAKVSLSIWPNGWILCRTRATRPCLVFETRKQALKYLGLWPKGK